jgi:hypothetical protein
MPGASLEDLPSFKPPFFDEEAPLELLRVLGLFAPPFEPPQLYNATVKTKADKMIANGFPTNLKFI